MDSPDGQPISLSENRDVLREILVRAGWNTVVLLFSDLQYGPVVKTIIEDNTFWYDKLVLYLGGTDLIRRLGWNRESAYPEYAKVFVSIQRASDEIEQDPPSMHGTTYLPSLLLIETIYGFPFEHYSLGKTQDIFWEAIDDVAVLDHVLNSRKYVNFVNRGIPGEVECLSLCLLGSVKRQNAPLCRHIAAVLAVRYKAHQRDYNPILREAIALQAARQEPVPADSQARTDLLSITISLELAVDIQESPSSYSYYTPIAESENVLMWKMFREHFKKKPDLPSAIVEILVRGDGVGLSFVLEQEGTDILNEVRWTKYLLKSIKDGRLAVVKILLPLSNVTTEKNQVLGAAAGHSLEVFTLVLSDPRIRPMNNLQGTILSILDGSRRGGKSKWYTQHRQENRDAMNKPVFSVAWKEMYPVSREHLLALTRDSRFDVRKLDLSEVRLLSYGLHDRLQNKLVSWDEVTVAIDPSIKHPRDELVTMLENGTNKPSVLDVLLRAILFCDLDPIPLARWMLASGENECYLASRSIVTNTLPKSGNVRVIRELLLILLEDEVSIREHIVHFREEGMMESDLALAVRLAALTLGPTETRRRI